MTREEALNTLMKMRAWRAWGKEQKEEERPEMPEQKEVDEAFDVCIELLQQPSITSNLDEEAEEYGRNTFINECMKYGVCDDHDLSDAFKAGAEWMAGQGETIDGEILTTSDYGWETIRIPKKLYPLGTKVTIQIRRK